MCGVLKYAKRKYLIPLDGTTHYYFDDQFSCPTNYSSIMYIVQICAHIEQFVRIELCILYELSIVNDKF